MNLTIDDRALNYAREKEGDFIVKTVSASGGCCSMEVRDITIEFSKDFKGSKKIYNSYNYKGVNVYVEKGLELGEDVLIYEKIKLPLIGSMFGSKGIYVKYF
ncbi:hypothetical protein [Clostridium luticellarii]|jgi:hypothetical protein|uniref:FeS cluster biogenesis domain-containing protein n=1 Tax=Clostridium luticellarii TaxID=1691940 RepID=A0A2T0BLH9_9CLOT|nr:hypothetical protein [Clostridium luticellarii]MCI1945095.1 hypothetical protein [Clostridium luticellarii]MCI1968588.1 hypothetical protein [Clostridium luticellarii]MCI1995892.1 hypothetical protein [Clostridium luticellarii]MCI2041320.1 hypothetical protein [Clostridium luticellarii]PRR84727.1 hypothetical protein CLLU_22660 [Clostridium luticellarii]